jgi:membrane-associated phospholipid phosphatase
MRGLFKTLYVTFALVAVALLGRRVSRGDTAELDRSVTVKLQSVQNPEFDKAMHVVSWAGFPPQSRVIPWLMPLSMLSVGRQLEALFQLLGWGTGAISGLVKKIVGRPRPAGDGITVTDANIGGSSFPSGHVIIYTGVYGFLAYLAHLFIPFKWLRRLVVGGITTMIALVGPSRVYLGHHWFSDVIASYLLGTSYLVVLTSIYQRVRKQ